MASITSAHHTGFQVADLDRSLVFYRDVLGFEVVFRWNPRAPYIGELVGYPDVDFHSAILRQPNCDVFLELVEYRNVERAAVDTSNANPGTAHIAFFVDDCDALYAELAAKGVEAVSEPVTPTIGPNEGGRVVYMIDPDGFRVEFIESAGSFGSYDPDARP
jgi:catechol 2,3-dioxygenase-like lactoylglutathione lyase family enzyme